MRFKTGLVVGFGIGYVLGARAGRRRYEQLKTTFDRVTAHPTVATAMTAADRTIRPIRTIVGEGMVTAAEVIRRRAAEDGPPFG